MARLSTLTLEVSKRSTKGSPQPHWPPAPSAWPLRTVESPTRKRVGSFGFAGGLRPILAWAAGSVVEPSIGVDLAGSCARSLTVTGMKRRKNTREILEVRRSSRSFGIEIVYAVRSEASSAGAYSQRHDL